MTTMWSKLSSICLLQIPVCPEQDRHGESSKTKRNPVKEWTIGNSWRMMWSCRGPTENDAYHWLSKIKSCWFKALWERRSCMQAGSRYSSSSRAVPAGNLTVTSYHCPDRLRVSQKSGMCGVFMLRTSNLLYPEDVHFSLKLSSIWILLLVLHFSNWSCYKIRILTWLLSFNVPTLQPIQFAYFDHVSLVFVTCL